MLQHTDSIVCRGSVKSDFPYINDKEVEPAPGVGEILDEAVGHPLQQHLQDKNVGEDLVGIFQDCLDGSPSLDVDVLECLHSKEFKKHKKRKQKRKKNTV